MNREIKAGDYVYIPSESTKPIQCFYDEDKDCLRIDFKEKNNSWVWFDKNGYLIGKFDKTNIPLLWLATPENKAKIEHFYGINLEDVPFNEVIEFERVLSSYHALLIQYANPEVPCNGEIGNNVQETRTKLIEMFKERGNSS